MPSSSLIAHRMRPSQFTASTTYSAGSDGLPEPTFSGLPRGIDGLSPHPSVHMPPFLSSTPSPAISGLERHPDAPKPFSSSFLHNRIVAVQPESPFADENLLSQSSLLPLNEYSDSSAFFNAPGATTTTSSSRSSRFIARSSPSTFSYQNYASNPIPPPSYDDDVYPTYSAFSERSEGSTSSGSSTDSATSDEAGFYVEEDDEAAYDGDDDRSRSHRRSPFADHPKKATHHQPPQLHLQVHVVPIMDPSTAPSPHSQCGNSGFNFNHLPSTTQSTFSEFTNYVAGGLSRLVSSAKSPASPGALSRLLMEYLRGTD